MTFLLPIIEAKDNKKPRWCRNASNTRISEILQLPSLFLREENIFLKQLLPDLNRQQLLRFEK